MAKAEKASECSTLKPKYQVKNWAAYNAGLKKRGSLMLWLDEQALGSWKYDGPNTRGGQYEYSDACILVLLSLKSVFRMAFRQLEGFVLSLFDLAQISLPVPSYSQICRRQKGLKVPLCIEKRLFRGESLPDLLSQCEEQRAFVDRFGGDGAYDTYDIWDLLDELEIQAIILPRDNAVFKLEEDGSLCEHPRNAILEKIVDKDLKTWKIESGYHRRSLSETTFFRWKITLGDKMWARHEEAQKTEAAVKSAVLNGFIQVAKPVAGKVA